MLKSLENISNEEVEQIEGRTFDDVMINTSFVGDMARSKFLGTSFNLKWLMEILFHLDKMTKSII